MLRWRSPIRTFCSTTAALRPAAESQTQARSSRPLPCQTCYARIVRPSHLKRVHEEHALLLSDKRLDLQSAQTLERLRELDLLQLAVLEPWASFDGFVLLRRAYLVRLPRTIGVRTHDKRANLWPFVGAAEPAAECVEPECRARFIRTVCELSILDDVLSCLGSSHPSAVAEEDRNMWRRNRLVWHFWIRSVDVAIVEREVMVRIWDWWRLRNVCLTLTAWGEVG